MFQPLASYGAFEDKKYEELRLINPNETIKDVTVRKTPGFRTIIFHSEGVMNVKPDRFSEKMLKELNYDLDEWAEHEKRMVEYLKEQRIEAEKKKKLEEAKKIAEEKAKQEAISQKNEQKKERLKRRMERLDKLSEEQKELLSKGGVKFASGFDVDQYIYNEFRKNPEADLHKQWIEQRFGKPDSSRKVKWKVLVSHMPIKYGTVEYDHWTYYNILKNSDTGEYTEDVSFSFRLKDISYNYSGPDWVIGSGTYQSLKESAKIMHESMSKDY